VKTKRGGERDQKNRFAAPLVWLWNQVDASFFAIGVPNEMKGGKQRNFPLARKSRPVQL
jgi:hypothetical protein